MAANDGSRCRVIPRTCSQRARFCSQSLEFAPGLARDTGRTLPRRSHQTRRRPGGHDEWVATVIDGREHVGLLAVKESQERSVTARAMQLSGWALLGDAALVVVVIFASARI